MPAKLTFLAVALGLAVACTEEPSAQLPVEAQQNDAAATPATKNVKNDYETYPDKDFMPSMIALKLPVGFALDSLKITDKAHNTNIVLHTLTTGSAQLDRRVKLAINGGKKDYIAYIEKWAKEEPELLTYTGNYYHYKLLSISESGRILSLLFLEEGYVNGMMNHAQYQYVPFNYNKNTNQSVSFQDVFAIKTAQDSAAFIQLINASFNYPGAEIFSLYTPDFIMDGEDVLFCYSPYQAHAFACGGFQVRVPKTKLSPWLNPAYQ